MGLFTVTKGWIAFTVLHFILFALALTTIGLYAVDLDNARIQRKYADSKWSYGVAVGSMSAITCAIYFLPFVLYSVSIIVAVWDFILFILWITLFGVFGKLFIGENPEGDNDVQRMKAAVWVDLTCALLWLIAALATSAYWWKHRDTRTRFTGRAHV